MKDKTGIDRLLEFEGKFSNELMAFKVEGMHLWPAIRTKFWMDLRQDIEGEQQAHAGNLTNWSVAKSIKGIRRYLNRSYMPYINVPKVDTVFLTTAVKRSIKIKGLFFDTSYDYYGQHEQMSSLFLEEPFQGKHFSPEYSKEIRYLDILKIHARLKACFQNRNILDQAQGLVDFLRIKVDTLFPLFHGLQRKFSGYPIYLARSLAYSESIDKIIIRTGARLVSLHSCGYGGFRSFLAKMLRDKGIIIVEFQHGTLGEEHPAYNYSPQCPFYRKYLPDYFLTYGEYWSNKARYYPPEKVVIGNPFLEEERQNKIKKEKTENKRILIVSQGTMTGEFIGLAKRLRAILPDDYLITFRLHPGEVPFRKERCGPIESIPGIEIQDKGDIFSSLREHSIVIGAYSTTVFEALPFAKKIFILDCNLSRQFIPFEIGEWFKNAEELKSLIFSKRAIRTVNWQYYWAINWEDRFHRFFQYLKLSRNYP